jgi:hypothetical protein
MPRYFFDVTDGEYTPDATGTELPGLEDARLEAVILSGNLLRENPAKFWHGDDWFIDVKDEFAVTLFTLAFRANEAPSIRGRDLPPLPPQRTRKA